MRILVDLDRVTVVLADAGVLDTVSVVVVAPIDASDRSEAARHRLADVLVATNVGRLSADGAVVLRADALRFHAAGQVDDDWERRFADACRDGGDGTVLAAPAPVTWPGSD
jgi:hypothetical protein